MNTMPAINQEQIKRGIEAMRAAMEITFEGQTLVKRLRGASDASPSRKR